MSKHVGIGKTSRLAKLGESVSVTVNGSTVTAKAARDLSSTDVLILFDGRSYHAYPHSKVAMARAQVTTFAKHERKQTTKNYNDSAVIVYRVRYDNGNETPCTLPYWQHYEGVGCFRICGSGEYSSLAQCNEANQDNDPFEDTYSVGYFKRGFLNVLGAPSTELGFFYPISTGLPDYAYCPGAFLSTGFTQEGAENAVIKGDGTFTNRSWILPTPNTANHYDVYLPSTDTSALRHSYYRDSRITAGVLQQWNSLYNLSFYRDGSGILLGPAGQVLGDNIPWEAAIQRLNPDGSLMTNPDSNFQPPFTWVGYPNWLWRQIDIKAIAIYNTIYFNGDQTWLNQNNFIAFANSNRRFYSGDFGFTFTDIRRPGAVLPPASIISRTYSANEETPTPPGIGWQLLWDTKTCPILPPIELTQEYDKYFYYVSLNGGEPKLLGIFRSDDNVEVLLTNLGNGRYRGALRCGTKTIGGVRYFAETRIFNSENETATTYAHPAIIPEAAEDWQYFKYRDWRITPGIPADIDICLRDRRGYGTNIIPRCKP